MRSIAYSNGDIFTLEHTILDAGRMMRPLLADGNAADPV